MAEQAQNPPAVFLRSPILDDRHPAFSGDLFQRKELADRLTELLKRMPDGAVISIDAPWGEGKTWFANQWHKALLEKDYRTAYIDCFQSDYLEDPFAMLAGEFLALTGNGKSDTREKLLDRGKKIGKALLPVTAKIAVDAIGHLGLGTNGLSTKIDTAIDAATGTAADEVEKLVKDLLQNYAADKQSIQGFKDVLTDFANEAADPIVIFLDELDRCRPDFAVRTLERIKHFFDVPKVVFVLLINRAQLVAAIKGLYGARLDAEGYLAKFIQLQLVLPKQLRIGHGTDDNTLYCKRELERYGFNPGTGAPSEFALVFGALSSAMALSLRDIERAVTLYSFGQPLGVSARYAVWPIMLKIKRPDLFRRAKAQVPDAHAACETFAQKLYEQVGDESPASDVLRIFMDLHRCGKSSFAVNLAPDTEHILSGYFPTLHGARSFLSFVFDRVDLPTAR